MCSRQIVCLWRFAVSTSAQAATANTYVLCKACLPSVVLRVVCVCGRACVFCKGCLVTMVACVGVCVCSGRVVGSGAVCLSLAGPHLLNEETISRMCL